MEQPPTSLTDSMVSAEKAGGRSAAFLLTVLSSTLAAPLKEIRECNTVDCLASPAIDDSPTTVLRNILLGSTSLIDRGTFGGYFSPKCRIYDPNTAEYIQSTAPFVRDMRILKEAFEGLHVDEVWSNHGTPTQAELWCNVTGKFVRPLCMNRSISFASDDKTHIPNRSNISQQTSTDPLQGIPMGTIPNTDIVAPSGATVKFSVCVFAHIHSGTSREVDTMESLLHLKQPLMTEKVEPFLGGEQSQNQNASDGKQGQKSDATEPQPLCISEMWYLIDWPSIFDQLGLDFEEYLVPALLHDAMYTTRHLRSAIVRPYYSVFQPQSGLPSVSFPTEEMAGRDDARAIAKECNCCASVVLDFLRSTQSQCLDEALTHFDKQTLFQLTNTNRDISMMSCSELRSAIKHTFMEGHDVFNDILFMEHGVLSPNVVLPREFNEQTEDCCFVSMAVDRRSAKLRDTVVSLDKSKKTKADKYQKPDELDSPIQRGTILAPTYTHTRVLTCYHFIVSRRSMKIRACWQMAAQGNYFAQLQVTPPISLEKRTFGVGAQATRAGLRFISALWKGENDTETLSRFLSRSVVNHTPLQLIREKMGQGIDKELVGIKSYTEYVSYLHKEFEGLRMRIIRMVASQDMFAANIRIIARAVQADYKKITTRMVLFGKVPESTGIISEFWMFTDIGSVIETCSGAGPAASELYQESIARAHGTRGPQLSSLPTEGNLNVINEMLQEFGSLISFNRTDEKTASREGDCIVQTDLFDAIEEEQKNHERIIQDYVTEDASFVRLPMPNEPIEVIHKAENVAHKLMTGREPFSSLSFIPGLIIAQGPFVAAWYRAVGRTHAALSKENKMCFESMEPKNQEQFNKRFMTWHDVPIAHGAAFDINWPIFFGMSRGSQIAEVWSFPDRVTLAGQIGAEVKGLAQPGSFNLVYESVRDHLKKARRRSIGYVISEHLIAKGVPSDDQTVDQRETRAPQQDKTANTTSNSDRHVPARPAKGTIAVEEPESEARGVGVDEE